MPYGPRLCFLYAEGQAVQPSSPMPVPPAPLAAQVHKFNGADPGWAEVLLEYKESPGLAYRPAPSNTSFECVWLGFVIAPAGTMCKSYSDCNFGKGIILVG